MKNYLYFIGLLLFAGVFTSGLVRGLFALGFFNVPTQTVEIHHIYLVEQALPVESEMVESFDDIIAGLEE